jgi:hypothetical protein
MLSVTYKPFKLSAVRLNVVMLSVVAPFGSTEAIKIIARSQTNLLKLNAPSFLSQTVFHLPNISTAEHCLRGQRLTQWSILWYSVLTKTQTNLLKLNAPSRRFTMVKLGRFPLARFFKVPKQGRRLPEWSYLWYPTLWGSYQPLPSLPETNGPAFHDKG